MTEEKWVDVYCNKCGKFYSCKEGSRADKMELCPDCLIDKDKRRKK